MNRPMINRCMMYRPTVRGNEQAAVMNRPMIIRPVMKRPHTFNRQPSPGATNRDGTQAARTGVET